jgi:hypothetical protein
MSNVSPGWYDDGSGAWRRWDGLAWTEHTQHTQQTQRTEHIPHAAQVSVLRFPPLVWRMFRQNLRLGAGLAGVAFAAAVIFGLLQSVAFNSLAEWFLSGASSAMPTTALLAALVTMVGSYALGTLIQGAYVVGASGHVTAGPVACLRHVGTRWRGVLAALAVSGSMLAVALMLIIGPALALLLGGAAPAGGVAMTVVGFVVLLCALAAQLTLPLYVLTTQHQRPIRFFVARTWAGLKFVPAILLIGVLLMVALLPGALAVGVFSLVPLVGPLLGAAMGVAIGVALTAFMILSCYLLTLRVDRTR